MVLKISLKIKKLKKRKQLLESKNVISFSDSFLILGLIFVSVLAETPSSTSSYLSDADRVRLRKVIEPGFQLNDVSAVHYAVLGHNLIGDTIPRTAVRNIEFSKLILSFLEIYFIKYLSFLNSLLT